MPLLTSYRWFQWPFLLLIALVSFCFYAVPFYPFLDSDIAVHVYMAEDFRIPKDLYFWNQDRLGSLSPMFAYVINSLSPLNAVWSIALVEWLFLVAACICSWYFIPSTFFRLLIALLCFFPNFEMRCLFLPSHPYNEQLALVLLSLICFDKSVLKPSRPLLLPLAAFLGVLAVWASDFSLFFYLLLVPVHYRSIHRFFISSFKQNKVLVLLCVAISLFGLLGIFSIKRLFPEENGYMTQFFASPSEMWNSFTLLFHFIYSNLAFNGYLFSNAIMLYALLPLIVMRFFFPLNRWEAYFLITALTGLLFLTSLRWVAINGMMLKYYIPVFMCFWMFLFSVRKFRSKPGAFVFLSLALIAVVASSLTFITPYKDLYQEEINYAHLKQAARLPHPYFIGDYWHSYVLGIASPGTIKTTPHTHQNIRNREMQQDVLQADSVYVVSNNWFPDFPDTLKQEHYLFIPANAPAFRIGHMHLRLYGALKSN